MALEHLVLQLQTDVVQVPEIVVEIFPHTLEVPVIVLLAQIHVTGQLQEIYLYIIIWIILMIYAKICLLQIKRQEWLLHLQLQEHPF